jgi:hypothetical protein
MKATFSESARTGAFGTKYLCGDQQIFMSYEKSAKLNKTRGNDKMESSWSGNCRIATDGMHRPYNFYTFFARIAVNVSAVGVGNGESLLIKKR